MPKVWLWAVTSKDVRHLTCPLDYSQNPAPGVRFILFYIEICHQESILITFMPLHWILMPNIHPQGSPNGRPKGNLRSALGFELQQVKVRGTVRSLPTCEPQITRRVGGFSPWETWGTRRSHCFEPWGSEGIGNPRMSGGSDFSRFWYILGTWAEYYKNRHPGIDFELF